MSAISEFKNHIQKMFDGSDTRPVTLYLGENVIETSSGQSRGEGSITVFKVYKNILDINDESRGYRGTVRRAEFEAALDEEEKSGRQLRCEIGTARDRRAFWQEANADNLR